jgi:four helix bundle protein
MATIKRLEHLEVWQEVKKLCIGIYIITKTFPPEEKYNIVKHLRESGRGVMGNIGEGFGRYFYKESMWFYDVARGCINEVKSDIILSHDLAYINKKIFYKFIKQIDLVDNKIGGLIFQTKSQLKKQGVGKV